MSALETIAVVLALAYVLLAMRQNRLCWVAAFISALLYLVIFAEVKLYMEAGLQIVYAAMAVVGWIFWGKDKTADTLPVTSRPCSFTRRRYSASLSGLGYRDLCSAPTRTQQDPLSMREQPSQQSFAPGWSPEKYSKTGFIGLLSTRFQSGYLLIGVSP